MKKKNVKILSLIAALALWAGAFFICGFNTKLPRGVTVNGVDVGRLTYLSAKTRLREQVEGYLKTKRLHICAGERVYEFAYPEIDYVDGFDEFLPKITRSGEYSAPVTYFLNGFDEIVNGVCKALYCAPQEPAAAFNLSGQPFTYTDGKDGFECDRERLVNDLKHSLSGGFEDVKAHVLTVKRQILPQTVRECTQKLYSFTTYFDGENTDRTANIKLAAEKINGTVLAAGEIFSFNGTVGARTEENGFKQAKIIEDGRFVTGFGGGVCQVSTTLYNAALLSGLEIAEYHPHSLQVAYVSPSRDAMVSGTYFDLKFKNNRLTPIYVRTNCTLNSVTCTIYGQSDGFSYSFLSKVTGTVARPPAVTVEGEEDGVITYGRDGTLSEGYLIKTKDGLETSQKIRSDKYRAVADTVQKKPEVNNEENGGELPEELAEGTA